MVLATRFTPDTLGVSTIVDTFLDDEIVDLLGISISFITSEADSLPISVLHSSSKLTPVEIAIALCFSIKKLKKVIKILAI